MYHNFFIVAENLLQKMETDIRGSEPKIPLLDSIASDISNIRRKLIFGSVLEKYSIARVTILISKLFLLYFLFF